MEDPNIGALDINRDRFISVDEIVAGLKQEQSSSAAGNSYVTDPFKLNVMREYLITLHLVSLASKLVKYSSQIDALAI